jgi:hypothetical protein
MSDVIDFSSGNFVHLGLGAATLPLPTHTGDMEWYAEYEQSHGDDGFDAHVHRDVGHLGDAPQRQ